jgi:hypothetical protein
MGYLSLMKKHCHHKDSRQPEDVVSALALVAALQRTPKSKNRNTCTITFKKLTLPPQNYARPKTGIVTNPAKTYYLTFLKSSPKKLLVSNPRGFFCRCFVVVVDELFTFDVPN